MSVACVSQSIAVLMCDEKLLARANDATRAGGAGSIQISTMRMADEAG